MGLSPARVWVDVPLGPETGFPLRGLRNQGLGTLSNHVGANHDPGASGLQRTNDAMCMSREGQGCGTRSWGHILLQALTSADEATNSKSTSETVRVDVEDSRC